MRLRALTAAVLLVVAAGALAPGSAPATTRVGFWAGEDYAHTPSGFDRSPDSYWNRRRTGAYTRGLWRVLARDRVPLYFNLRYERDFGPVPKGRPVRHDALPLLRRAQRLGIPLWAWIVVPYSDGYWSWQGNARVSRAAVVSFHGWARRHGLRFRGVALDSEPSLQETSQLFNAFGGNPQELTPYLNETVDPARQCAGIHAYEGIIGWAHSHGVRITAAAYPPVLDDLADGKIALQDALDVATLPPRDWNALYFMAYRTLYEQLFGSDPGSGLVASYFRSARQELGPGGQVTLGIAGTDPYTTAASLTHDVRVLATLRARAVPIYSLETTAKAFGARAVARIVKAARRPFRGAAAAGATATTPAAEGDRAALRQLDAATVASTPLITANGPGGAQTANDYSSCGVR